MFAEYTEIPDIIYGKTIIDEIKKIKPSIIYIAVGSAHENGADDNKNQQHPIFIDNMRKQDEQIVSIQFDPRMESPMTMEGLFIRHGDPLTLIEQINNNDGTLSFSSKEKDKITFGKKQSFFPNETPYFRIYKNNIGYFFIINDRYFNEINNYMTEADKLHADYQYAFLTNLIEYVSSNTIKLIMQYYTGYDTTNTYTKLLDIYGYSILKHICFDITHDKGGCYIDLPATLDTDKDGNFIQYKFMQLIDIKDYSFDKYKNLLTERINLLCYPIALDYINMQKKTEYTLLGENEMSFLKHIYHINIDQTLLSMYEELIFLMITDIIMSLNEDQGIIITLLNLLQINNLSEIDIGKNRSSFQNTMAKLKIR
jgi:hypothetical protein